MKSLITIAVAALAAFGAERWSSARRSGAEAKASPERAERVTRLGSELSELRAENERLARALAERDGLSAAPAAAQGFDESEIGAALARWREQHPEALAAATPEARTPPLSGMDVAHTPMSELVRLLAGDRLDNLDRQQVFQELREAGRIDEYVAAIEALCQSDPKNADLQVALGNAYLQKLFGVGHTPEAGTWAVKADQAFDVALTLDDHNWGARFTKAVALSNWPAFMGRGPEAIENLEVLLEQQAGLEPQPQFAMTYLFLGNIYQANNEPAKALATWRAGLEQFPRMEELRRALEAAESDDSAEESRGR